MSKLPQCFCSLFCSDSTLEQRSYPSILISTLAIMRWVWWKEWASLIQPVFCLSSGSILSFSNKTFLSQIFQVRWCVCVRVCWPSRWLDLVSIQIDAFFGRIRPLISVFSFSETLIKFQGSPHFEWVGHTGRRERSAQRLVSQSRWLATGLRRSSSLLRPTPWPWCFWWFFLLLFLFANIFSFHINQRATGSSFHGFDHPKGISYPKLVFSPSIHPSILRRSVLLSTLPPPSFFFILPFLFAFQSNLAFS